VASERTAAFAPAGVGLALLVVVLEIRMDEPWANGVLLLVAAVPAAALVALGFAAARDGGAQTAAATVLLVAGLALAAVAIARLGEVLAGDDFAHRGGTLTWMLGLFAGLSALCASRTRAVACLLVAALAAVGLFLEAVNWIFDTENVDTFRALLAASFAVLFGAGLAAPGRAGTVLIGAAGVTLLASTYAAGAVFVFLGAESPGLGWGWELVMLVQGLALLAYAAVRLEPGPAYLAFFGLASFATFAAVSGGGGGDGGVVFEGEQAESEERSLVGWPLALAIGTVVAALWGARGVRRDV
jgi:hypothetical protein